MRNVLFFVFFLFSFSALARELQQDRGAYQGLSEGETYNSDYIPPNQGYGYIPPAPQPPSPPSYNYGNLSGHGYAPPSQGMDQIGSMPSNISGESYAPPVQMGGVAIKKSARIQRRARRKPASLFQEVRQSRKPVGDFKDVEASKRRGGKGGAREEHPSYYEYSNK